MPLRAYVSIATLFSVILICSPSGTAAQEIRNKPSGRPTITRQATAADAELGLRADVIDKMKESRASAEKLMVLHEEENQ
jgi:hypothetical protein